MRRRDGASAVSRRLCLVVFVSMAVLGCLGAAAEAPADGEEGVDIGLFARVVTSDPARREGAKAGRLDEFRAEDVFLAAEIAPDESDRWFLIDGIFDAYPAKENEADWFNRGGFSKLQPHYARTSDIRKASPCKP